MDEKNQQTLTLDSILNQLTKPSVLRVPDQNILRPPLPNPSSPGTIINLPTKEGPGLPSLGNERLTESKSFLSSSKPQISNQTPGISLSVRTMDDDLARLKQGQKPLSKEFLRVIQGATIPKDKDSYSSIPPYQNISVKESVKKPESPLSSPPLFKPKPPPLPSLPSQPPIQPQPTQKPSEIPPNLPKVYPGLPPIPIYEELLLPSLPINPVSPPSKSRITPLPEEKVEYRAIIKVIGHGMTTGVLVTIVVAVAIYLAFSFFIFNKDEIVVVAPVPTPKEKSRPVVNELDAIFSNISIFNFMVPPERKDVIPQFKVDIHNEQIARKEFKKINVVNPANISSNNLVFTDFLDIFNVNYPTAIKATTNQNYFGFIYGQDEFFDDKGQLTVGSHLTKKIVFIAEVTDPEQAQTILTAWEPTLIKDLVELFEVDPSREASPLFLDNSRNGVKIRYKNFPFPDKSIDYSIITSLTGKSYIIITNSRESMYSPTDKVRGL